MHASTLYHHMAMDDLFMGSSHLLHLVFQHPFDLVAHVFGADGAEMHEHFIGGLSYLSYQHLALCSGWWLVVWRILNAHILQSSSLGNTLCFDAALVATTFCDTAGSP